MQKLYFLFITLGVVLFFTACEDYSAHQNVRSGGAIDEVLVIMDNQHVPGSFADTLNYLLAPSFPALPQAEPRYDIRIRSYHQFEGAGDMLKKYRTIIFAAPMGETGAVSQKIKDRVGDELIERSSNDTSFFYATERNVYASPQLIIYMFASTQEELVQRLSKHRDDLFRAIASHENQRIHEKIYAQGKDKNIQKSILENFNLEIQVPSDYLVYANDQNLVWLNKTQIYTDSRNAILKEIKQNLIIRSFPLSDTFDFMSMGQGLSDKHKIKGYPVVLRDETAAGYVFGADTNFPMHTDTIRPIFQNQVLVNGVEGLESRGLWRLQKPFMGGPFVNYIFVDEQNQRLIMVDAFVFAAGSPKRKYVRELESIIATIQFH